MIKKIIIAQRAIREFILNIIAAKGKIKIISKSKIKYKIPIIQY
jgi:hypothetical protein